MFLDDSMSIWGVSGVDIMYQVHQVQLHLSPLKLSPTFVDVILGRAADRSCRLLLLQELVVDVAFVTSFRHADLS